MLHRILILTTILLLFCTACSQEKGDKSAPSGEVLLQPDNGFVILLREGRQPDASASDHFKRGLVLIAGGAIMHYPPMEEPMISRNGHMVGCTVEGETVISFFDGGTYTFENTKLDDLISPNHGFGISRTGKKAFKLGMGLSEDEDNYVAYLYVFDTKKRRPDDKIIVMNIDPLDFDEEDISRGFSAPLIMAEKGSSIFYRRVQHDRDEVNTDEKGPDSAARDILPVTDLFPQKPANDYYRYDTGTCESVPSFAADVKKHTDLRMIGCTYDGLKVLCRMTRMQGGEHVLVVRDESKDSYVDIAKGAPHLIHPRISPEGSRVGYFRETVRMNNFAVEAVIVPVISGRADVHMELVNVREACWSDDLKYIAYVSNSFRSSIIKPGEEFKLVEGDMWYLHLVDVEKKEDSVIYSNSYPQPFSIVDILIESEEMIDKSKLKPRVTAPGEEGSNGGSGYSKRGEGEGFDPKSGPSITAK